MPWRGLPSPNPCQIPIHPVLLVFLSENTRFVCRPSRPSGSSGPSAHGLRTLSPAQGFRLPPSETTETLYRDIATNNLYGPKTAGSWGSPFQLSGTATGADIDGTFPDLTLVPTGVTAGTGSVVTVDANGRVTDISPLQQGDIPGGVEFQSNKNIANGYAGLDPSALIMVAQIPAFSGNVSTVAGSTATTIGNSQVQNSMLAFMAAGTVKANIGGSSTNPSDVSLSAFATALGVAVTAVKSVTHQVFTGTGTYTPNANMLYCLIECQGAGGGGGGAAGTTSQSASGGGGGAGEYTNAIFSVGAIGCQSGPLRLGPEAREGPQERNKWQQTEAPPAWELF